MSTRAFSLLLSLVLLCVGFTGQAHAVTGTVAAAVQTDAVSPGALPEHPTGVPIGEHHPLDLSAQPCAETVADGQALLLDGAQAPLSALAMARPRPYAAPARLAPYLDGPQRPPSASARFG